MKRRLLLLIALAILVLSVPDLGTPSDSQPYVFDTSVYANTGGDREIDTGNVNIEPRVIIIIIVVNIRDSIVY